jgi:hypothetical protein
MMPRSANLLRCFCGRWLGSGLEMVFTSPASSVVVGAVCSNEGKDYFEFLHFEEGPTGIVLQTFPRGAVGDRLVAIVPPAGVDSSRLNLTFKADGDRAYEVTWDIDEHRQKMMVRSRDRKAGIWRENSWDLVRAECSLTTKSSSPADRPVVS